MANTVGLYQPFRYRGYVYDTETQLYYLQSRYYDPATCRFISADVLLSTGQGVIGHNSFAYCGNNPIVRSDPSGCSWWDDAWNWVKGAAETVSNVVSEGFDNVSAIVVSIPDIVSDLVSGELFTDDSDKVVERMRSGKTATVYEGTLMLTFTSDYLSSFTPGPFVMLNTKDTDSTTVKHEYGHSVQWKILGTPKYIAAVAAPSVITWTFSDKLSEDEYYSMPWERSADYFGKVSRPKSKSRYYNHASIAVSFAYLSIVALAY